jgi:hypothetical protein
MLLSSGGFVSMRIADRGGTMIPREFEAPRHATFGKPQSCILPIYTFNFLVDVTLCYVPPVSPSIGNKQG